jgi:hypothetical protein
MKNEDPPDESMMDDEQAGDAVARYFEENPELLRGITPARDLWPAIDDRISARVIPMSARATAQTRTARKRTAWIPMLIAASALIAGSAGITYVLTTRSVTNGASGTVATTAPVGNGSAPLDSSVRVQQPPVTVVHNDVASTGSSTAPETTRQRRATTSLASHHSAGEPGGTDVVRDTYDSEITALHAALERRRGQLNPSTVAVIEQNLQVIDDAIRQSKAALAKDPNSRLLNDQLDRTLAKKTGLLRAAALLPAA